MVGALGPLPEEADVKTVVVEWDTHSGKKDRVVYRETDMCAACGKPETEHCTQDSTTKRWVWHACRELIWGKA